jgi:hypothetical protein
VTPTPRLTHISGRVDEWLSCDVALIVFLRLAASNGAPFAGCARTVTSAICRCANRHPRSHRTASTKPFINPELGRGGRLSNPMKMCIIS